ncbi:MAG: recombinase family protein [Oscillospiraceae bacterium]|nr:recombinase family protein [Oscillospiraceae bacterium]
MIYGYARCSTDEAKQDIERQKRELKEMGATDKTIYFEYASGAKVNRLELLKLLDIAKNGDTIVTTEISRLTRSTKQLCDIIQVIKGKQLKLVVKNSIVIDCTNGDIDPMTNAFLQISGVFAELERNMISERVKSGMANAKEKGKQIGRKPITADDVPQSFYKHYPKYKTGELNKRELSRICDISYPTVYKYLRIIEK